jgi:hypothetical protein
MFDPTQAHFSIVSDDKVPSPRISQHVKKMVREFQAYEKKYKTRKSKTRKTRRNK